MSAQPNRFVVFGNQPGKIVRSRKAKPKSLEFWTGSGNYRAVDAIKVNGVWFRRATRSEIAAFV